VLLLDEPLSNLDAKLRVSIRAELLSIHRQLGITTLYVTHDQEEALAMSDWVAVMNGGKVVQWGTPWEIYYRPRKPFMADFVGSVNLVPATVVTSADGIARVRVGTSDLAIPIDGELPRTGSTVILSIRPESVRLECASPDGARFAAGDNAGGHVSAHEGIAFAGEIVRRTYLGHLMRYTVRAGDLEWLVDQSDPGASLPLDGAVTIYVNPARIHIIPDADPDIEPAGTAT